MFSIISDQSTLGRKFGIKMKKINGGWAKLRNVESSSISYSTDTIILIKLGGSEGNKTKCFVDKPQE